MPPCYRCDDEDRDTTKHTLRFEDDRQAAHRDLCAVCVRRLRQADNEVRSITTY